MNREPSIRIVLVRPRDSRNVGAVCRAMKTMGITSLSIVMEGLIDPGQARALAHHAADVLERAAIFTDLADAVAGAALVAGTTRRRGRRRKYFSLFPEQLAERVQSSRGGEVAVVFGNEDAGLSDRELAACHLAVTIPSSSAFPSLNLSHAVQLVCYEIYRALTRGPSSAVPPGGPSNETEAGIRRTLTPFSPISVREIEALVSVITRSLQAIGFFTIVGPDSMAVFWKDIIARAGLSVGEARRLGVVFRKIGGLVTGRGIDPKPLPP